MTTQQAQAELARLCVEMGKSPKEIKPEQMAVWLKALQSMPYEKGRLAVNAVRDQWESGYFPPVGFLNTRAKALGYDGAPNAIAYSQDSNRLSWGQTPEGAYAVWRDEQVAAMRFPFPLPGEPEEFESDEDRTNALEMRYWAYVHDQDGYKGRCASHWRQEWQNRAQRQITTVN